MTLLDYIAVGLMCFVAEVIVSEPWEDKVNAAWFLNGLATLLAYLTLWPLMLAYAILKGRR